MTSSGEGSESVFPRPPRPAADELAGLRRNHEALVAQTARYAHDLRGMYQKERTGEDNRRRQLERIRQALEGDALSMVFQPWWICATGA